MQRLRFHGKNAAVAILATILGATVSASPAKAVLVHLFTLKGAKSTVKVDGIVEDHQMDGFVADSVASFGSLLSNGARTAARSSTAEIAVNAQFINTTFMGHLYEADSRAGYDIEVRNVGPQQDVMFEFFLPPALLELQGNGEIPSSVLEAEVSALIFAQIVAPTSGFVLDDIGVFSFGATLRGSFNEFDTLTPTVNLNSLPSIDPSPLLNPVITVTPPGQFTRTITAEFPSFAGAVNLGPIGHHERIRVFYGMEASVNGEALFSSAVAAINDPFRLTDDPIDGVPLFLPDAVTVNDNNAVPCIVRSSLETSQ